MRAALCLSEILSDSDARLCKTGGNARCGQLWRSHSRQVIPTGLDPKVMAERVVDASAQEAGEDASLEALIRIALKRLAR